MGFSIDRLLFSEYYFKLIPITGQNMGSIYYVFYVKLDWNIDLWLMILMLIESIDSIYYTYFYYKFYQKRQKLTFINIWYISVWRIIIY